MRRALLVLVPFVVGFVAGAGVVAQCAGCVGDDVAPPAPDAGECLRWSPTICTPAGCCVDAGGSS